MNKIAYDSALDQGPPCSCGAPSHTLLFLGKVARNNFIVQCPSCHGTWWVRGLREVLVTELP